MNDFIVVIPARYASTRLPGKPLLDIAGKPMVVWVAERAKQSGAKQIIVATDHQEIFDVVASHGYQAMMTRTDHLSGTDRIAEVTNALGLQEDEVVVNVQGDEPMIAPSLITETAQALHQSAIAVMSTACHPMIREDWTNPNAVKVVLNKLNHALYFSRASIPFARDSDIQTQLLKEQATYRHIGIYAYRAGFLKQYANMQPANIERIESLEQLRVLYEGYQIAVNVSATSPASGVDCQADLDLVRQQILRHT